MRESAGPFPDGYSYVRYVTGQFLPSDVKTQGTAVLYFVLVHEQGNSYDIGKGTNGCTAPVYTQGWETRTTSAIASLVNRMINLK